MKHEIPFGKREFYKNIGKTIKKKRIEKCMTQATVAEVVNISILTYRKIEKGESAPDLHLLFQMSLLFDINDMNYFFLHEEAQRHKTATKIAEDFLALMRFPSTSKYVSLTKNTTDKTIERLEQEYYKSRKTPS